MLILSKNLKSRWENAQKGESRCWEKNAQKILTLEYQKNKKLYWKKILKKVAPNISLKTKRILDVGCGPSGIVVQLNKNRNLVCLDPLMNDYLKLFPYLHKFKAKYINSQIEKYKPAQFFDVIFGFNCLDHVNDINRSLSNLKTILSDNGRLIISMNCHNYPWVQRILFNLNFLLDKLHPHQFLMSQYKEIIRNSGFKVIKTVNLDNETHWINNRTQANEKKRFSFRAAINPGRVFFKIIESIFGVSRYGAKNHKTVYSHIAFICEKK